MSAHTRPRPAFAWHRPRGGTLAEAFRQAWRAVRTRQALAELDDRMLRDIGLTRGAALREAERAPWDRA